MPVTSDRQKLRWAGAKLGADRHTRTLKIAEMSAKLRRSVDDVDDVDARIQAEGGVHALASPGAYKGGNPKNLQLAKTLRCYVRSTRNSPEIMHTNTNSMGRNQCETHGLADSISKIVFLGRVRRG